LRPEHSGPYQVMNRLNDRYSIQDLVSGKVINTHVYQLRPFDYDFDRTRPVDRARQTAQEFLKRNILAHRGDRNRRRKDYVEVVTYPYLSQSSFVLLLRALYVPL
jgi:hypothetical protein